MYATHGNCPEVRFRWEVNEREKQDHMAYLIEDRNTNKPRKGDFINEPTNIYVLSFGALFSIYFKLTSTATSILHYLPYFISDEIPIPT